jgi:hypothetical protein
MNHMRVVLALVVVAACASPSVFVPAESSYRPPHGEFQVELPQEWMRLRAGDAVTLTRDGFPLQTVRISRAELGKPLPSSKRVLTKGLTPFEAAEVLSGDVSSQEGVRGVKVIESSPAQVSDQPGFKIVYAYKQGSGLARKRVFYGLLTDQWLWLLSYDAPERVYFEKDLPTFEQVVRSFRLAPRS